MRSPMLLTHHLLRETPPAPGLEDRLQQETMSAAAVNLRGALPFARIGFLNMLAYRARYYVGVLTYLFNVAVYYFIWRAVYRQSASVVGLSLPEMFTYVAVGWTIRSFYFNEIDRDIAAQWQEGRLAMNLIRPVDVQTVMI